MNFKDNLRKVRSSSNFSQEKLAEKMSVSRQTISKWENGESFPSTKHVLELTKILHCTYDELINGKNITNTTIRPLMMTRFLLAGLVIILSVISGIELFRLAPTRQTANIDNAKLAAFDTLTENFIANTNLLPNEDVTTQIVGYGITDEDGTFYVKCDVFSNTLPGNHCSAIIYFCENNGSYSYRCEVLDDSSYHPSGEYYQIV